MCVRDTLSITCTSTSRIVVRVYSTLLLSLIYESYGWLLCLVSVYSATFYYINRKNKIEKENESENLKEKKPQRKQTSISSKTHNLASKSMLSSHNMSQNTSVAEGQDDQSLGKRRAERAEAVTSHHCYCYYYYHHYHYHHHYCCTVHIRL